MLSKIPINLNKISEKEINLEIIRVGIIAELDAINLYEQMAAMTNDKSLQKILLDIAREEKIHAGEFLAYLLKLDREQEIGSKRGREEIEELLKE